MSAAPDVSTRRRYRRLADVLLLDGFRAAPAWMSLITVMIVIGTVGNTCYPLGYRLLVDGALQHSTAHVVWGVVIVGGLLSLGWALVALGGVDAMSVSDRVSVFRIAGLIRLISGIPGIEHLERPEYLTEVERLTANRRQLAAAPRQLISNISSAVRVIALMILLATIAPILALLPIAAAPPLIADRIAKRITTRAENEMAHDQRLAGMLFWLASDPGAAAEVRSYGLSGYLAEEHSALSASLNRRSSRETLQVLAVQCAGWLVYAAALMGAIWFVAVRAAHGHMSLGTVLMATSLIRRSRAQLASAASGSGAMVSTLATADRLFWLQDHAAQQSERAGHDPAPARLRQGIELRDVRFAYPGTDRVVLDGFSATLPAGSTVALIGANGSGKSTLIKLLLDMYQPDGGAILIDGVPLAQLDPEGWLASCSAAFQDYSRLQMAAVHSIGVADLPGIDDEPAALSALHRAGAEELAAQLPDGLGTRIGTQFTGGLGLSGGQWQKLALGRAMRRPAPLLMVLDEPTASLDPQAEHALFERYSAAAQAARTTGAITVLVSHRFTTVQSADLIIYLEDGHAAETGTHDQLLGAGGRYAELFELQAAGYR